jgi:hypothetical protein
MAGANLLIWRGVMAQQTMPRPRPAAISKQELIPLLKLASAACYSAFDSLSGRTMGRISSHPGEPFPPEPTRRRFATLNNMVRHSVGMCGYVCV